MRRLTMLVGAVLAGAALALLSPEAAPLGAAPDTTAHSNLLLLNENGRVNNWVVVDVLLGRRIRTTFSASQVALSRDGSYVALLWPNADGIDVAAIDGSRLRTLLKVGGSHYVTSVDWAPTGDRLVYALSTRTAPVSGGVYVVRRDGRGRDQIADAPATEVRWAPDGSLIAFEASAGVYVMRPNGSSRRLVDASNRGQPQPISWSSDGKSLLSVHAKGGAASAAFVIDVSTGRRSLVPRVGAAAFAPRGRWMLVARGYHLYFARLLVGPPTRPAIAVATNAATPVWGHDGQRIAYTTTDGLWVFNVATGERRHVLAWRLRPVEAKPGLAWATSYP